MNMNSKLQWVLVIVASMALGAGVIVGIDEVRSGNDSSPGTAVEQVTDNGTSSGGDTPVVQRTLSDLADLVEDIRPSVVQINASNPRTSASGVGSGIILDKEGNILTNNHVIDGFAAIDVTLSD